MSQTEAKSLILCSPNLNPKDIWDLDITAAVLFRNIGYWLISGNHGQGTRIIKTGADTPRKYPRFICPSPQAWDFDEKQASLGVRSPCCKPSQKFYKPNTLFVSVLVHHWPTISYDSKKCIYRNPTIFNIVRWVAVSIVS